MAWKRFAEAAEASDRALDLDSDNLAALRIGIKARLCACDWRRREDDERRVSDGVRAGQNIIAPFDHRALRDSEAEALELAQLWEKRYAKSDATWRGEAYRHNKIRIAYFSPDLRDHVVADVIAGCFEQHDRAQFETTAISLGPDDGSKMRARLKAAFDRFVDGRFLREDQIAAMLREFEIDIAVDLNCCPGAEHGGILARRAAPIQVNYLGYPGTKGVPFVDYLIADPILTPQQNRAFYTEQIACLPYT
jgi:protein O-GlcNAc transferase